MWTLNKMHTVGVDLCTCSTVMINVIWFLRTCRIPISCNCSCASVLMWPPHPRDFWSICENGRLLLQNSQQISRNFHNYTRIVMNSISRASIKKTKRNSGGDGFIRKRTRGFMRTFPCTKQRGRICGIFTKGIITIMFLPLPWKLSSGSFWRSRQVKTEKKKINNYLPSLFLPSCFDSGLRVDVVFIFILFRCWKKLDFLLGTFFPLCCVNCDD